MTDRGQFCLGELVDRIAPPEGLAVLRPGQRALPVSDLAHDARLVGPGMLFFCIVGAVSDGHDFAAAAAASGAVALIVERPLPELDLPQIVVADSRRALAQAAQHFYGYPSHRLRVTGITGTNGKTTTAYILDSLLRGAGRTTGLIGTVETHVAGQVEPAGRTTPDALALQQLLARMVEAGVSDVVMEVSSHALDLERTLGTRFACTAFTNLSQDHLDWHHDMESYFVAKKKLFVEYEVAARVINVDDAWGRRLFSDLQAFGRKPFGVGELPADSGSLGLAWDPTSVHYGAAQTKFSLCQPESGHTVAVQAPLVGAYNVHNVVVAAGCALQLGLTLEELPALLARITPAPGRLQPVEAGQDFAVLVDYAHTDDALRTALGALREVTRGQILTVFGCGGDRDHGKRPLMGRAAAQGSDYVVATSDNPRSEDPRAILAEVETGLVLTPTPFEVIVDRAAAIRRAISLARSGDCVFIAGKGHEDYQIFADQTIHFDDREIALWALRDRGFGAPSSEEFL